MQPEVPASDAALAPLVKFPGLALRGQSVLESLSDKQPKRIPTIFPPSTPGTSSAGRSRFTPWHHPAFLQHDLHDCQRHIPELGLVLLAGVLQYGQMVARLLH